MVAFASLRVTDLIVPAAGATYLVESLAARLVTGWCVATLASGAGLYASFRLDLPTGAAIVCTLGIALLIAVVTGKNNLIVSKKTL